MDFRDRHVVVTGGTGALGTAVVGALVEAGAVCHVPFVVAAEAERFALRSHAGVRLVETTNLADEAAVAKLYDGVPRLWASIHLAGGFAMGAVAKTGKAELMKQLATRVPAPPVCRPTSLRRTPLALSSAAALSARSASSPKTV